MFARAIFRLVDRGKELHPVAHRDHHFALGVVVFDVVGEFLLRGRELLLRDRGL